MSQTYEFKKGKHKITFKDTNTQIERQLNNKQHIFKDKQPFKIVWSSKIINFRNQHKLNLKDHESKIFTLSM